MSDTKKQNNLITECKELLETNRNIILNGAPGTGKTYLAKQIAAKMIDMDYDGESTDNDPIFKEYVRLVQFHPSYDYTDFVEGLRPISADGQIGFKRKDGVFKALCADAIVRKEIMNVKVFPWTDQNNCRHEAQVLEPDNSDIKINIYGGEKPWYAYVRVKYIREMIQNDFYKSNDGIEKYLKDHKTVWEGQVNNKISPLYKSICDSLIEKTGLTDSLSQKFVFIIDEINRGEISKIFGELFFSIDPGYRGTKGRVDTQYQNLITDNDCFKDGFYVPEDVYIIGTMNDIDRSVESMDFAFRRRFAFKEVQASDTDYMLSELGQDVKKRMTDLNNAITDAGFTSAYHVGASYFLKLKESGYNVEKLWNYHLKGLLKEYLRGREDAEKILNDWEVAYDPYDLKKTVINNDNTTQG